MVGEPLSTMSLTSLFTEYLSQNWVHAQWSYVSRRRTLLVLEQKLPSVTIEGVTREYYCLFIIANRSPGVLGRAGGEARHLRLRRATWQATRPPQSERSRHRARYVPAAQSCRSTRSISRICTLVDHPHIPVHLTVMEVQCHLWDLRTVHRISILVGVTLTTLHSEATLGHPYLRDGSPVREGITLRCSARSPRGVPQAR